MRTQVNGALVDAGPAGRLAHLDRTLAQRIPGERLGAGPVVGVAGTLMPATRILLARLRRLERADLVARENLDVVREAGDAEDVLQHRRDAGVHRGRRGLVLLMGLRRLIRVEDRVRRVL